MGVARAIRFDVWQDAAITLDVAVNGVSVRALLDSGATASLVDANFHATLAVRPTELGYNVETPTGATQARASTTLDLSSAGQPLCSTRAAIYDLQAMSAAYGVAVQFILGRDFFESFVLEFDFLARTIQATPHDVFDGSALAAPLPLGRCARHERWIDVAIAGQPQIAALVDLEHFPVCVNRGGFPRGFGGGNLAG